MSSVLSYQEKQIVDDAFKLASQQNLSVVKSKEDFGKKGSIGLWWDAKGLFRSSNKQDVLRDMDVCQEIYDQVVTCMEKIAKGDKDSYELLLKLYGILETMKNLAINHKNQKSKALCRVATNFLESYCKLDHKLKRVECVVLKNNIRDLTELTNDLSAKMDDSLKNLGKLHSDNQQLQNSLNMMINENLKMKASMREVLRDNQVLKDTITESTTRADQQIKKMEEENRRNMENLVTKVMEENKRNMENLVINVIENLRIYH